MLPTVILLWTRRRVPQMQGISWIAKQLFASQEEMCSVELVTRHIIDYFSSHSCNFCVVYYAHRTEMTFSNEFVNIPDVRARKINRNAWASDVESGNLVQKFSPNVKLLMMWLLIGMQHVLKWHSVFNVCFSYGIFISPTNISDSHFHEGHLSSILLVEFLILFHRTPGAKLSCQKTQCRIIRTDTLTF